MISNFNKGAIFQIIFPKSDEIIDKSDLLEILQSFQTL